MWTNTPKEPSEYERGALLTPDGNNILVGDPEEDTLIYQDEESLWSTVTKTT